MKTLLTNSIVIQSHCSYFKSTLPVPIPDEGKKLTAFINPLRPSFDPFDALQRSVKIKI